MLIVVSKALSLALNGVIIPKFCHRINRAILKSKNNGGFQQKSVSWLTKRRTINFIYTLEIFRSFGLNKTLVNNPIFGDKMSTR